MSSSSQETSNRTNENQLGGIEQTSSAAAQVDSEGNPAYFSNTITVSDSEQIFDNTLFEASANEDIDHVSDADDHGLDNLLNFTTETREIDILKDICTSENLAEVDVSSLLGEYIPHYKLRADNNLPSSNSDWIQAPLYFDEEAISELTNEQIQTTLDYFILSGNRVSQMTKTYYDIEAVTKLLDEKEKDLELAATIGKQLLERDQQLECKIEYLELEVEKTSEMVNQLRHDITCKDNLLKTFIESESDNYQNLNAPNGGEASNSSMQSKVDADLVNRYEYKIQDLETENDLLRIRYDNLEKEAIDMKTVEAVRTENSYREIDEVKSSLQVTEAKLKEKTSLCTNQQEEIQNLFSQIIHLQQTVKNLNKDNQELESNYDTSVAELIDQINDLKEKYNECLKVLSRTQEDLLLVRKRYPHRQRASSKRFQPNIAHLFNATCTQAVDASNLICDDDDDNVASNNSEDYSTNNLAHNTELLMNSVNNSHRYDASLPSNSNSLATEMFCSLAKDYRSKNNLSHQAYQSSDFIKKVKHKLTKQIPGSHIDSCMQSDSEMELMLNSFNNLPNGISSNDLEAAIQQQQQQQQQTQQHRMNNQFPSSNFIRQFTNCPTPDSMFSTGSASVYSNLIAKSNSFILPEKLQIVKPIEGSQTLQHWQNLARPNLGCLFESRPGISLKNNGSDSGKSTDSEKVNNKKHYDSDNEDDGVNSDMYEDDEDEFDINDEEIFNNFDQRSDLLFGDQYDYNIQHNYNKHKNTDMRVLSPNRVELLSNLLKNEENNISHRCVDDEDDQYNNEQYGDSKHNFFYDILASLSGKYFSNNKSEQKINVKENFWKKSRMNHDYDDPDTPPSSPINTPTESNVFYDTIKSAFVQPFSSIFQSAKRSNNTLVLAPTPPGTPQNELDEDYITSKEYLNKTSQTNGMQLVNRESSPQQIQEAKESSENFFNQIARKLNLFSFKKPKPAAAPTPPGTPQNELDEEYINSKEFKQSEPISISPHQDTDHMCKSSQNNFFDQIVNKLSLFSFKSVANFNAPTTPTSTPHLMQQINSSIDNSLLSTIVKPLPVYAKNSPVITPVDSTFRLSENEGNISSKIIQDGQSSNYFKFVNQENLENNLIKIEENDEDDIEPELVLCELNKKCETPPPSPSKFSPPLPEEDDYDLEDMKKSAFVKVASLNPLINKSIDLNSLLGSLSYLKKNQRACKYY